MMADPAKLKQLILYVAAKLQDADYFGSTKLNKALYNAEAANVRRTGRPLTGFRYQKNHYGPTLLAYKHVVREMIEEGLIREVDGDHGEERLGALVAPDLSLFSDDEIAAIDAEIDNLQPLTAGEASDQSHQTAAWWATDSGHPISWDLAFVEDPGKDPPLSHAEEERARDAAERYVQRSKAS